MPRRAKVRPDEPGRDKVLEAGLELFGSHGYDATSIADIGERAGVAKSVLYHYFSSKAELYRAIAEAETRALLEHVGAAVPPEANAPRLRPGIDAYLEFLSQRPATWRLLLRDPPADPGLRELHARLAGKRAAALAGLLAGPEKLADDAPHVQLVATAVLVFAGWWYEHREIPRSQIVDAIADVAGAASSRIQPVPSEKR
jgi:AcrR family transcriptional regulator